MGRLLDLNSVAVNQLIQKIGWEMLNPQIATDRFLEALTTSLAIELSRHISQPQRPKIRTSNSLLSAQDLQDIIAHIDENIDNPRTSLRTPHLARHFQIGETNLRRAFKCTTGQSIQSYIAELRLAKAKSLLREADSIKSIAFKLGFNGASAFSHAFKLRSGVTATEYRNSSKS